MLKTDELNNFFDTFLARSNEFEAARISRLNDFHKTESEDLKIYLDSLGDLEKQQKKVNFSEFGGLQNAMINDLLKFNPKNVLYEAKRIYEYTEKLVFKEKEFSNVSNELQNLANMWSKFLDRNPSFKNTNFDMFYKEQYKMVSNKMMKIGADDLASITADISNTYFQLEKLIVQIEKITEYIDRYIYIGEENEKLQNQLKDLMYQSDNYDVKEFFEVAANTLNKIDKIVMESYKARVPVPVVKIYNKHNPKVYKYTLRFGDKVVYYENFFEDSKNSESDWRTAILPDSKKEKQHDEDKQVMKKQEMEEFVYLDNFPLDGIFSGRDVVENLDISMEYQIEVDEFSSKAITSFVIIMMIFALSTLISMFIGKTAIFINLFFIGIILLGFRLFLNNLKTYGENKRNMPAYFLFSKVDFWLFKEGDDFYIGEALWGAIQDFDNTILNKKFHASLKKNAKYVLVNKKNNMMQSGGSHG
ncbi:hypothetical protein ACPF04_06505 [Campylobacter sp. MOP51]|uniref:hypothetical protein n=1 Tax=Campylobacter canis TaxID=3378588 RepID=UPI003C37179F